MGYQADNWSAGTQNRHVATAVANAFGVFVAGAVGCVWELAPLACAVEAGLFAAPPPPVALSAPLW